jgi:hypothetical protein
MANAYFTKVNKARKSDAKSFEYNGETYVQGKTKTGMVIYKKKAGSKKKPTTKMDAETKRKKSTPKKKTTPKKKATPKKKTTSKKKTVRRVRKAPAKKSGRILRGKRNSPSTSATSVKVGTKRIGGDGKMYVCKSYDRGGKKVQRWVKA